MKLSLPSVRPGIRDDFKFFTRGLFPLKALYPSRGYCAQTLKRTFLFTGGEIVNESLMSTGNLAGLHEESCPVYKKLASLRPAWMRKYRP
jgi:hypothetical protein